MGRSKSSIRRPAEIRHNRQVWVEALRSGQYLQGKGFLKQEISDGDFSYCCLGVACEVAKACGVDVKETILPSCESPKIRVGIFNGEECFLPSTVIDWLGLDQEMQEILAHYNDEKQYSFEDLASLIEKFLVERNVSVHLWY